MLTEREGRSGWAARSRSLELMTSDVAVLMGRRRTEVEQAKVAGGAYVVTLGFYLVMVAVASILYIVGTVLFASLSTRTASLGMLSAAPTVAAAGTAVMGLPRPHRWVSAIVVAVYLLAAWWELQPWQTRPGWSAFLVAGLVIASTAAWVQLVLSQRARRRPVRSAKR